MEKQIILQLDESLISEKEKGFLEKFLKICENEGFAITKKTEAGLGDRPGLFCVAVCDSQEEIDTYVKHSIPVIAYERDENVRLNNPYIILSFEGVDTEYVTKVHHRFFGLPLTIMETKRTIIREFCMDDLDDLFHLYEGEHVTDYMEPLFSYEDEKEYEKNYIKNVYHLYDYGMWLVIDKKTNEVIGRAGIESRGGISGINKENFSDDRNDESTVELGYLIREDYQNKGYATEVCTAIVKYAFETLEKTRIYAQADVKNTFSVKLLKKLGFLYMGAELFERIR